LDRLRRLNNFVGFPLAVVGCVGFVFVPGPVRWWFGGLFALVALLNAVANVATLVRNRRAEQTER
jgi:hypothetical protein